MKEHKSKIIDFLNDQGHIANEEEKIVWTVINHVKTEWNWRKNDQAILIGFGNDHADIVNLERYIPSSYAMKKTKVAKNGTNVIKINQFHATPEDFEDIVKKMEKLRFNIVKQANPQDRNVIKKHHPGKGIVPPPTSFSPSPNTKLDEGKSINKMTKDELKILESFLQYGDLRNANLIFMGYEEGVAKLPEPQDVKISIEARKLLHNSREYTNCRFEINGDKESGGWYIDDKNCDPAKFPDGPLYHAIRAASIKLRHQIEGWNPPKVNVINMQTRLHWLLQEGNKTYNYTPHKQTNHDEYNHLRGRHMIDFYPFPKRSKKSWDEILNVGKITKNTYYNQYNTLENNRRSILLNLYNNLPMNITVSYLGKNRGNFLIHNFYQDIGFENFTTHDTGVLIPGYDGPIRANLDKPKKFQIGERIRTDGHKQIVVLTPFFGCGQISYKDIDALATWL